MTATRDVLVVAERVRGRLIAPVFELLTLGRALLAHNGGRLHVALAGDGVQQDARELIARGADRVYVADDPALAEYQPDLWLPVLEKIARLAPSAAILVPHTHVGTDLAPRLAFRLGAAVATGCVDMAYDENRLRATRTCYGGNAHEAVVFKTDSMVATVRAGLFEPAVSDPNRTGELISAAVDFAALTRTTTVTSRERSQSDAVRLEDAKVVIAGGRGLAGAEGFELLQQLARELNGAVGASRVPCDIGWCPHSMQIGLTGKTVAPALYVAVGISGAGHHMAGCARARTIVAINTDPDAAIYQDAHLGIVADYRLVIPALIESIRRLRAAAGRG